MEDNTNDIRDLNIQVIEKKTYCCTRHKHSMELRRTGSLNNQHSIDDDEDKMCFFKRINFKKIKRLLPCLFAWTLLLSTSGFYFLFVLVDLYNVFDKNFGYWLTVACIQMIILFYTVLNFLMATFRDPGKYPKLMDDSNDDVFKSPLYKNVMIKNSMIKTKWCSSCNFYRPLRCSHCSVCNACVDQFDRKSTRCSRIYKAFITESGSS